MKTRKIMALMLTLTIIVSALFMGGNTSAAKKKPTYKEGTTYTAVQAAQKKGSLTAYMTGYNLYVKNGNNKAVKLTNIKKSSVELEDGTYPIFFFTDGARVFYNCAVYDGKDEFAGISIYVYTANTGKTKCLNIDGGYLLGGNKYGVVSQKARKLIYTDINGISEKIGKAKSSFLDRTTVYFNGEIFYESAKGRVAYNINSKKTRSFKGSCFTPCKNYLYYLNDKSNLIRMDKKGNKVKIDTKVNDIMGANDGKTVLYKKIDNQDLTTVTFYRATGKKIYELTDAVSLAEDVKSISENAKYYITKDEKTGSERVYIGKAAATLGDNIYFMIYSEYNEMILKINKNGGKAKFVKESGTGMDIIGRLSRLQLRTVGNKLYFGRIRGGPYGKIKVE